MINFPSSFPYDTNHDLPNEGSISTMLVVPLERYTTPSSRWTALVNRDAAATNAFIYAVTTTRIFCRPDCRARLARRANVRFYNDASQAERDGFRACKRCKPGQQRRETGTATSNPSATSSLHSTPALTSLFPISSQGQTPDTLPNSSSPSTPPEQEDIRAKIDRAVDLVRDAAADGKILSLSELSQQVGLSKWHLQRVFKRIRGVTPREMAEEIISANERKTLTLPDETSGPGMMPERPTTAPVSVPSSSNFSTARLSSTDEFKQGGAVTPAPAMRTLDWADPAAGAVFETQTQLSTMPAFMLDEDDMMDMDTSMRMGMDICAEDLLNDLFPELYGEN